MFKEIINLAVLNAFKMDPADTGYPLIDRVPGKRLACLNWGPSLIKVGFATRGAGGFVVAPEQMTLPASTPLPQVVEALKLRTDCNCVAVLYSAVNLFCEAQIGPKIEGGEGLERRLRTDAKSIVGSMYEEDKIYQLLVAPDGQTRVVFALSKAPYEELEKSLIDGGLTIVRSQMGAYTMLNALLGDKAWEKSEEDTLILPMIINQAHVIVAGYNGARFLPEVFRATPLFWEKSTDSQEFVEQVRAFFLNCAESAVIAKKVFGKQVTFRFIDAGTSPEAALDLGSYLQDRVGEVGFERWDKSEPNIDFKALIES